jgi:hypothetical protein
MFIQKSGAKKGTKMDSCAHLLPRKIFSFPLFGKGAAIWVVLAALICSAVVAFAQIGTASLNGVITDSTGAVVPNADVALRSTQESLTRTTKTASNGEYVLPSLQPGSYEMSVHAAGFQDQKSAGIELSSGQVATLNLSLTVAGAASEVTVQATAPLMQTTSASLGTVVTSTQMNNLPILGGSFLNAMVIGPGTVPVAPPGTTYNYSPINTVGNVMPSVFGQREKDNDFLLDGVENRDPDFLGVPVYPPLAAIAEMKVDSGVGSAVYGHGSGAAVNVVTKSGTNQWHGEGWEYLRNNVLEARSFFVPSLGPYRWNQFGVAIGGPLQIPHLLSKDKAWYVFGFYEGVRIRSAANYTTLVPTPSEISGNFARDAPIYDPYSTAAGPNGAQVRTQYPGNVIAPATELNQMSAALAKALYPTPNLAAGVIPGVNYLNSGSNRQNGDQWSGRVDHQFGQRDNFFARYTGSTDPTQSVTLPTLSTTTSVSVANVVVSDTHIISPKFVVTGRYGLMRDFYFPYTAGPPGLADQSGLGTNFGLPVLNTPSLPGISIPGYSSPGFGLDHIYSLQNSWTGDAQKIAGEHTIEFGGGVIHTHFNDTDSTNPSVVFASTQTSNFVSGTGNAFASFLLGAPNSAVRLIGTDEDDQTTNEYGAYVQDTWRHGRLTVNLGVRWDFAAVPHNKLGLGTFDFGAGQYVWDITNPVTGAPANIRRGGIPNEWHAFAPRVGIAYAMTPRTIVRSSYGIFFNTFGSQYIQGPQGARGNWPFSFPQSVTALNPGVPTALLPDPFPSNPVFAPACSQCLNVDQSSTRTPYVQQWTFSLQRQMGHDLVVEADYFGSHGVKLGGQIIDDTATVPGPGPIAQRQIFPQFSPYILNNYDEFQSWYQAGSLQVRKSFSHGLQFMVNYTYSKNLDVEDNLSNAGLGGAPTSNPTRFNVGTLKGPAGFSIPQLLVASGVWTIPGSAGNRLLDAVVAHWSLSGIANFRSGLPFMTVSGRSTEFPNSVGDPHAIQPTVQQWFNKAAFAVPAPYTIGDVGRNILTTDHLISTDLSIYKDWELGERRFVELRGEFFNLFNHANFGYPGTQIGTAQFGAVSSTLNPGRQVQLVAKIRF